MHLYLTGCSLSERHSGGYHFLIALDRYVTLVLA